MKRVKENEKGAALLSVLLLVALMSIAAIAMLELTMSGVQVAKAADERGRTSWQIAGAEQAGLIGVQSLWNTVEGSLVAGTPGLGGEFLVEVNDAILSLKIEEASNCFNVNSLLGATQDDANFTLGAEDTGNTEDANPDVRTSEDGEAALIAEKNYLRVLNGAGFTGFQAETLMATLLDWMDADNTRRINGAEDGYYANLKPSYRSSGRMLAELSELRSIRGYTKEVVDKLQPFLCVRADKEPAIININTVRPDQSVLLSMVLSGELSNNAARDAITTRPLGGWGSIEEMFNIESIMRISPELRQADLLATKSTHLIMTGQIAGNGQATEFSVLYRLSEDAPARIVSRSLGAL
jgi:general secretion pathway protein K